MGAWGTWVVNAREDSSYTAAALKALKRFPIDVKQVELVTISENVTFRVSAHGADTDYVLRLHRPGYNSVAELESERIWTAALKKAGVLVQDALLTHEKRHFVLVDIPGRREQRYAGITTWLEGELLGDYLETSTGNKEQERLFRRIGRVTAAMHNQSTSWNEPPDFNRRRLDLDGLLGENPVWGRFWEHSAFSGAEMKLLLRTRQELRVALGKYTQTANTFSLIHADLHPQNIIYKEGKLALIDFDDSAYGWHMYDIASALIENSLVAGFETCRSELLDGYREYRSLSAQDEDMLWAFMLIRGMAIIGWYHQRPEHDGSDFFAQIKSRVIDECKTMEGQSKT